MADLIVPWLKATAVSQAMTTSPWLWPVCETLHFIGLALLVGAAGLFDLRLLGLARRGDQLLEQPGCVGRSLEQLAALMWLGNR